MANLFFNLPATAGDGVGAAVDTSGMGKQRTITVEDTFQGSVIIEASCDVGVTWGQVATFTNPGKQIVLVAANRMRVRRSGVPTIAPGLPNVDIGANDAGGTYASLAVTAGNGTGAPTNLSTFGPFKTVTCVGPFRGTVNIEVSEDGVDYVQCYTFTNDTIQSKSLSAQFVQVQRSGVPTTGPGLPVVAIGATNEDDGGGGGGPPTGPAGIDVDGMYPALLTIHRPRVQFVYRPGGVAGANVYTVWSDIVTAMSAVAGQKDLLFDDSIVSPIPIPVGSWDMTDVVWTGIIGPASASITIPDGVDLPNLRQFRFGITVDYTGVLGPSPVSDLGPDDVVVARDGARVFSSGTVPFFDSGAAAGAPVQLVSENGSVFGNGVTPVFTQSVPNVLLVIQLTFGQIASNALASVVGSTTQVFAVSNASRFQGSQPGLLGTVGFSQFGNPWFNGTEPTPPNSGSQGDGMFLVSAGTSTLPASNSPFTNGTLALVTLNAAIADPVSVAPAGGDTIEGSAAAVDFRSAGGFGAVILALQGTNWFVIGSSGANLTKDPPRPIAFVYRPGGTQIGPFYSVWGELVSALATVGGPKTIYFDDSVISPAVIPAGAWAFPDGTVWSGSRVQIGTGSAGTGSLFITDGATFTGVQRFENLTIHHETLTTPPFADGSYELTNCTLSDDIVSGTALFSAVAGTLAMELENVAVASVLESPLGGGELRLTLGTNTRIFTDMLNSDVANTVTIFYSASSARIIGAQANNLGTIILGDTSDPSTSFYATPRKIPINGIAPGPIAAVHGSTVFVDTTPATVDLPELLSPYTDGEELTVVLRDGSAGIITINAFAGQTILTAASLVITDPLGFESVTLSPFGTNWSVI